MTKCRVTPLKGHIAEISVRKGDTPAEILSVTNSAGFVRSLDVFDKQVFSQDASNYKLVRFDDLAYNPARINVGSVARCQFPEGGAVSPMYVVVRCNGSLLPKFLVYFLKSDVGQQHIVHRAIGAVRSMLRFSDLEQIELPIPPLAEQARIVRALDEAEALRDLRAQVALRFSQIVPASFFTMFGDPTSNSHGLPIVKLGDIAKLERGRFTPRPRNDPAYFGGQYPFIQTGDISASGGLLSTWQQTLNERGRAVSREFPPGTIVFAIVGATIGATAILQIPVYCPDSIIGIEVDPDYALTEYVEFVLRSRRPLLLAQAPDAARANLNLEILRDLQLPLAPLPHQTKFVNLLLKARELEATQTACRERVDELFRSLLHQTFSGSEP